MKDCPKFVEWENLFHGKPLIVVKVQLVVEMQIVTAYEL
jgi:hypothetical protein